MKLPQLLFLIALAGFLAACGARSGGRPLVHLPEAGRAPGWSKVGTTRLFPADRLWQYIDGDAERFLQAGVVQVETADYRWADQIDAVVDLYTMKSPEAAAKIWNGESASGSRPIEVGDAGRHYGSSLTFRKGRYFVRLVAFGNDARIAEAMETLARAVAGELNVRR